MSDTEFIIVFLLLGIAVYFLILFGIRKDRAESLGEPAPSMLPLDKLGLTKRDFIFGGILIGLVAWNMSLQSSLNDKASEYHDHRYDYAEEDHGHNYAEQGHSHNISDLNPW